MSRGRGTAPPNRAAVGPGRAAVPKNGDVNPYGVAAIPRSVGRLHAGDVLVRNSGRRSPGTA